MTELFKNSYCPKTLGEFIGDTSIFQFFIEQSLKGEDTKPMLLYGKPGTGKSTIVNILAKEYNMDIFISNASDERNKINENIFHTSSLLNDKRKLIVFDEIDGMSQTGFKELEKFIQNYSIILICNDINKIPKEIKSKCIIKEMVTNRFDLKILADQIIKAENLQISKESLNEALKSIDSYRSLLDFLQFGITSQKGSFETSENLKDTIQLLSDNSSSPDLISLADIYMNRSRQGYKNGEKISKFILDNINKISNDYPRTYRLIHEVRKPKKSTGKISIIGFK